MSYPPILKKICSPEVVKQFLCTESQNGFKVDSNIKISLCVQPPASYST